MRYITMKTLSEKFDGRSRSSLYRDIEAGRLPKPKKFGSRNYFDEEEVDAKMAGK